MNIISLVFSPTGGTARVARALTAVWKDVHYVQVDISKANYNYKDIKFAESDVCYISFPVFEGRVPAVVLDRLSEMEANNVPTVLVAVYGNRSIDDALLEMKTEIIKMGFCPVAAVAAVAEHSILRQHATGRPDEYDLVELEQFGKVIQARILSGEKHDIEVPGNYPYCVIKNPGMKPTADEQCTMCGMCSEVCPVGAIPEDMSNHTNHDLCIACMRCVTVCPQKARCYERETVERIAKKIARLFEGRKSNSLYL